MPVVCLGVLTAHVSFVLTAGIWDSIYTTRRDLSDVLWTGSPLPRWGVLSGSMLLSLSLWHWYRFVVTRWSRMASPAGSSTDGVWLVRPFRRLARLHVTSSPNASDSNFPVALWGGFGLITVIAQAGLLLVTEHVWLSARYPSAEDATWLTFKSFVWLITRILVVAVQVGALAWCVTGIRVVLGLSKRLDAPRSEAQVFE